MAKGQHEATRRMLAQFRQQHETETRRRRRAAAERLLEWSTSTVSGWSRRQWTEAKAFLEELHRLAWEETHFLPPDRIGPRPAVSRIRIRAVHADVQRALAAIAPMDSNDRWERRSWRPPVRRVIPLLISEHGRLSQVWQAEWPDTVWVSIMGLLDRFGREVRRCPVCAERRLFLKHRRQAYCSRACSQRARAARWYATHRDVALERRHEAYVRKVLKGRKGRVVRRRRPRSAD